MRRAALLFLILLALTPGSVVGQGISPPFGQPGVTGFPPLPTTKPPPLPPVSQRTAPPARPGLPPPGGSGRMVSSGTGFVVATGRVMTNQHVVQECRGLSLRTAEGAELPAWVVAADRQRDLALLAVEGNPGPPLRFRAEGLPVRRGEGVVTYGFPLAGLLSSGPTLTTGEVSALAGLADNQRQFQISAPVQPGNSGGPLLDMGGQVVGVIVSKLNAQRIAQQTGDIPQNVNFAVKGVEAMEFLRRHGVTPATGTLSLTRNAAEVGEAVHPSVLFVRCLG